MILNLEPFLLLDVDLFGMSDHALNLLKTVGNVDLIRRLITREGGVVDVFALAGGSRRQNLLQVFELRLQHVFLLVELVH